jgi:hypothetical protein
MKVVILLTLTFGFASAAVGAPLPVPVNANCPWSNPENSWQEYLSNKYGRAVFSLRFDHIDKSIFGVPPGVCYSMTRELNGHWTSFGFSENRKGDPFATDERVAGDPQKFELNFAGRMMHFDESGAVYDREFGRIGTLTCFLGQGPRGTGC